MKLIETRFVYSVHKSCKFSFGYFSLYSRARCEGGNAMGKRKLQLICEGNYAPGWVYFKRNAYKSWQLWQCRVLIVETKRIKDWKTWSKAKQNKQNADSQSFNMQSTLLSRSGEEMERGSNARSRSEAAAAAAGSAAALLFLLTRLDLTGLTIKTNVAMSWRWRYVWRLKNKTHTHTLMHWEKQQQKKLDFSFCWAVARFDSLGLAFFGTSWQQNRKEKHYKNVNLYALPFFCFFFLLNRVSPHTRF